MFIKITRGKRNAKTELRKYTQTKIILTFFQIIICLKIRINSGKRVKNTHKENTPLDKTQALMKNMNMETSVFGTYIK